MNNPYLENISGMEERSDITSVECLMLGIFKELQELNHNLRNIELNMEMLR